MKEFADVPVLHYEVDVPPSPTQLINFEFGYHVGYQVGAHAKNTYVIIIEETINYVNTWILAVLVTGTLNCVCD